MRVIRVIGTICVAILVTYACAYLVFIKYRSDTLFPVVPQKKIVGHDSQQALADNLKTNAANIPELIRTNPSAGLVQLQKVLAQDTQNTASLERIMSGGLASPQSAGYETRNLEDFRAISSDPANGEYVYQLDARSGWQELDIHLQPGDALAVSATGQACSPPDPCAGPNGQMGLTKLSKAGGGNFPCGDAMFQALVAKWDNGSCFQLGADKALTVPTGASRLKVMANIRMPFLSEASGGFRLKIIVRRKT